jgi:hypothetical protein
MKKQLAGITIVGNLSERLQGPIDKAIEYLEDLKTTCEFTDLYLELDYSHWSDDTPLVLKGSRSETDAEYKTRLAREKKLKEQAKKDKEKRKAQLIKEAKKLGLKVCE